MYHPLFFSQVSNDMTIAREEIFGYVLSILPYADEAEAIAIVMTLVWSRGYIGSSDPERARAIARQLRAGMVKINGAVGDLHLPFGRYKPVRYWS